LSASRPDIDVVVVYELAELFGRFLIFLSYDTMKYRVNVLKHWVGLFRDFNDALDFITEVFEQEKVERALQYQYSPAKVRAHVEHPELRLRNDIDEAHE
jgi:hypothetical protein